jgi:hypothetical protein
VRRQYTNHKASAKQRGIPFLLTYAQWLAVWQASGRLDRRGHMPDNYCMARFGDRGAYAVGNVKIITMAENGSERVYPSGRKLPANTKKKISAAMQAAHLHRRRSGLPSMSGGKYRPLREPTYWDFGDGRGPIEENKLTRDERWRVRMAKRIWGG